MAVLREYRNTGIGSALTEASIGWAEETGLHKLCLSVFSSNTSAIALYKKFGFVEEGRRREQICIDGKYVNEILMARFI
jgi:ribosomal protein S18 acetylase RimI-like enzyme